VEVRFFFKAIRKVIKMMGYLFVEGEQSSIIEASGIMPEMTID